MAISKVTKITWLFVFALPVIFWAAFPSEKGYEMVEGSRETYGDWHYAEYFGDAVERKMPITLSFDREGEGAFVQVFCSNGYLQVGINFGQKVTQDLQNHPMSYRFNGTPPVTEDWFAIPVEGEDSQLLQRGRPDTSAPSMEAHLFDTYMMALDLAEYGQLLVNTRTYKGTLLQRTFSLRGSHEPVLRVMRSCGYG